MSNEKTPLLTHTAAQGRNAAGDNSMQSGGGGTSLSMTVPGEVRAAESVRGNRNHVLCQVCSSVINLDGKMNQLVVKCAQCNEATPIKAAPPGKVYIRCSCNCLLICKSLATRVACPRPDCRKIIALASSDTTNTSGAGGSVSVPPTFSTLQQTVSVTCARCETQFSISVPKGKSLGLARCPHCHQASSVGSHFARSRWIFYAILAGIVLTLAAVLTVMTVPFASSHWWMYLIWALPYLLAIFLSVRWAQYFFMPVSAVVNPGPLNS